MVALRLDQIQQVELHLGLPCVHEHPNPEHGLRKRGRHLRLDVLLVDEDVVLLHG
jgi:hypothetical protein